ncbi:hypothetical protein JW921_06355 [Candidatus Fermentibacterales bacterium]|nr:hypothetical protein [Candidatus Fermentibacterales bacterium]
MRISCRVLLSLELAVLLLLPGCGGDESSDAAPADTSAAGYGPLDIEQEVRTQPGTPVGGPVGIIREAGSAADAANARSQEQQAIMDSLLGQ